MLKKCFMGAGRHEAMGIGQRTQGWNLLKRVDSRADLMMLTLWFNKDSGQLRGRNLTPFQIKNQ